MPRIQQLLEKIREKLFQNEEANRLKSLHSHLESRESQAHADFLDTHHENGDHQARVEHHASNFWHYYYPGEHPNSVLSSAPLNEHVLWTEEQHLQAQQRMIDPAASANIAKGFDSDHTTAQKQQHWTCEVMIGELALEQGNYDDAEKQFRAVMKEADIFQIPDEQLFKVIKSLARTLSAQGKFEEFEQMYERALLVNVDQLCNDGKFPEEDELNHIAANYVKKGREEDAKELYRRLIAVLERVRGPKSAVVARCLSDLAGVYALTGDYVKAEELLKRSIEIVESLAAPQNTEMAASLHNLGALYQRQSRISESQELFGRAMAILEKNTAGCKPV